MSALGGEFKAVLNDGDQMATVSGALPYEHRRSDAHCRSEYQGTGLLGVLVRPSCLPLVPLRELVPSHFQPQTVARPRRYMRELE
jgi:hypothetical protein